MASSIAHRHQLRLALAAVLGLAGAHASRAVRPPAAVLLCAVPALYATSYTLWLGLPIAGHSYPTLFVLSAAAFIALASGSSAWAALCLIASCAAVVASTVVGESRYSFSANVCFADAIRTAFTWDRRLHFSARLLLCWGAAAAAATAVAPASARVALALGLASLLAVEARLCVQQRRRGAPLPLSAHARVVLAAQRAAYAERGCSGFADWARLDGRLCLGDSAWRSCAPGGALTCAFLWQTNVAGLNTPPCCAAALVAATHAVCSALCSLNLPHWIDGGTLLGAVRDATRGGLVPWEDDADVGVLLPDDAPAAAAAVAALRNALAERGLMLLRTSSGNLHAFALPPRGAWARLELLRCEPFQAPRVDIVPYSAAPGSAGRRLVRKGDKGDRTDLATVGLPAALLLPTRPLLWSTGASTKAVCAPAQPEAVLRALYGAYEHPVYTFLKLQSAVNARLAVDARFGLSAQDEQASCADGDSSASYAQSDSFSE